MRRKLLTTFEMHHPPGFDIINAFLDQAAKLLDFAFVAAKQPQTRRHDFFDILVNAGFQLFLNECLVIVAEMDLGHFDLLLFSLA
jgi:hypothetical protein